MDYNRAMWASSQLTVTPNAMQLKEDLFDAKSIWMIAPLWGQKIITAAELPPRIRDQYDMKYGWLVAEIQLWLDSWRHLDRPGVDAEEHGASPDLS